MHTSHTPAPRPGQRTAAPALAGVVATAAMLLFAGCGPSGQLASYNPTDDVLVIRVGSLEEAIGPRETRLFRWRGSPFELVVTQEDGTAVERLAPTPARDDRWLLHTVGGERCFGVADFGPLYQPGSDGALEHVAPLLAASWIPLDREMDVWPGGKLPIYSDDPEIWGAVDIPCTMAVDSANAHAAIHGKLDELKPQ